MGLDAFVRCNCYEEGRTKPLPFDSEVYVEDGYIQVVKTKTMSGEEYHRLYYLLLEWSKDCCAHEDMEIISERVGNWASVRHFQQAMANIGNQYFPVLSKNIPSVNGGCLEAESAVLVLQELELFAEKIKETVDYYLVDITTGNDVYASIKAYDGIFAMSKRNDMVMGVDENGFFIKSFDRKKELFRSSHFIQTENRKRKGFFELIKGKRKKGDGAVSEMTPVLLTDIKTGHNIEVFTAIGLDKEEINREFQLVRRKLSLDDFYSYEPLKRLVKASIEVGNPVIWT